jgi:F0F1-type ATP synthase membrane subunit c/vacuolar-type H+-ATPase subunit K
MSSPAINSTSSLQQQASQVAQVTAALSAPSAAAGSGFFIGIVSRGGLQGPAKDRAWRVS